MANSNLYRHSVIACLLTILMLPMVTAHVGCPPQLIEILREYDEFLISSCGTSNLTFEAYWLGFLIWADLTGPTVTTQFGEVPLNVLLLGPKAASREVKVEWTPPPGATGLEFNSHEPTNPDGPPPFVFTQLAAGDELEVTYQAPALPAGRDEYLLVDTFEVTEGSGVRQAYSWTTRLTSDRSLLSTRTEPTAHPAPSATTATLEDRPAWQWELYVYPHPEQFEMNEGYCQAWVDLLQAPETFVAMQFALTGDLATSSGGYRLPVVLGDGFQPRLELLEYRNGTQSAVVEGTFQLKPELHSALASDMPSSQGSAWLALAPQEIPALECPSGLRIPAGSWEVHSEVWLDLGDQTSGDDVDLAMYVCIASERANLLAPFAANTGLELLHAPTVACLGPGPIRLENGDPPTPPFEISGPGVAVVDPPDQVQFHHHLLSRSATPVDVDVAAESARDLDWMLYAGTWDSPDLDSPVDGPITLEGLYDGFDLWVVGDVPATAEGAETVTVTATWTDDPDHAARTTNILWIGADDGSRDPRQVQGRAR